MEFVNLLVTINGFLVSSLSSLFCTYNLVLMQIAINWASISYNHLVVWVYTSFPLLKGFLLQ